MNKELFDMLKYDEMARSYEQNYSHKNSINNNSISMCGPCLNMKRE